MHKKEQFEQFDTLYEKYMRMESDEIASVTGCLKPCTYKEYKIINSKSAAAPPVPVNEVAFGLLPVSKYTEYEEEVYLITYQTPSLQCL